MLGIGDLAVHRGAERGNFGELRQMKQLEGKDYF
jgi:hypothetical protein